MIKQINNINLLILVLKRFEHWYINSFLGWLWTPMSCADRITGNIVGCTSNKFCYPAKTLPNIYHRLGFFVNFVLLTTGALWKRFCQRVSNASIPSSVTSFKNRSKVSRSSNVTADPALTSHFSIKPNTLSAPWPRPVANQYLLHNMVLHEEDTLQMRGCKKV